MSKAAMIPAHLLDTFERYVRAGVTGRARLIPIIMERAEVTAERARRMYRWLMLHMVASGHPIVVAGNRCKLATTPEEVETGIMWHMKQAIGHVLRARMLADTDLGSQRLWDSSRIYALIQAALNRYDEECEPAGQLPLDFSSGVEPPSVSQRRD